MAALIRLDENIDWQTSGALFDWVLEFLAEKIDDAQAQARFHEVIDNNLGSVWLEEFELPVRQDILHALSADLVEAGERSLPDGDRKEDAVEQLRALARMAKRLVS